MEEKKRKLGEKRREKEQQRRLLQQQRENERRQRPPKYKDAESDEEGTIIKELHQQYLLTWVLVRRDECRSLRRGYSASQHVDTMEDTCLLLLYLVRAVMHGSSPMSSNTCVHKPILYCYISSVTL